eukprot:2869553-Amphidinium_carterae.1
MLGRPVLWNPVSSSELEFALDTAHGWKMQHCRSSSGLKHTSCLYSMRATPPASTKAAVNVLF